jgi:hypothetical protein
MSPSLEGSYRLVVHDAAQARITQRRLSTTPSFFLNVTPLKGQSVSDISRQSRDLVFNSVEVSGLWTLC